MRQRKSTRISVEIHAIIFILSLVSTLIFKLCKNSKTGKDKIKSTDKNLNADLILTYGFALLERDMFIEG